MATSLNTNIASEKKKKDNGKKSQFSSGQKRQTVKKENPKSLPVFDLDILHKLFFIFLS